MTDQENMPPAARDVKLWAAFCYLLWPFIPILVLMNQEKRQQLVLRFHAVQSLIIGSVLALLVSLIITPTLGCGSVIWLLMIYWALRAYQGTPVTIPVLSSFIRQRGWI
jgi:uncharacterized membrane protein